MKEKVICGIQQVGIGVEELLAPWKWYHTVLGFEMKIFDDEGVAERMLPYTGGKPQPRRAILAFNPRGGGGFEVWQPKGRKVKYPERPLQLGDYGINICKIKAKDVDKSYAHLKNNGATILSEVCSSPFGFKHFYFKDPWNNIFEVEQNNYAFIDEDKTNGGVNGVVIGVKDMEKSIEFYGKLLDYDTVVGDVTGTFDELGNINGGKDEYRRVMLKRSKPIQGPLSDMMGDSHIELIQCRDAACHVQDNQDAACHVRTGTLENRYWGDPGYIHLCFDVRNMDCIKEAAEALGHPFVCDGGRDFDMGDANGHFTYVEDPNGTLIEFVETFKVPVMKKFGIYLNLGNRDDYKPLPKFMTKAMRFSKVKVENIK
ncbi:MAG: VOC family protein [Lentimicrobiaceae bacterium]|nr:VOC family protein [Lentimicrobiaceae bacterium]